MEEKLVNELTDYIKAIARKITYEVIQSELPRILDNLTLPGNGLSDLIDYNKAAKMLSVTKTTLHNYINSGRLTKYYVIEGGKPFLSTKEIESLMKKTRKINSRLTIQPYKGEKAA